MSFIFIVTFTSSACVVQSRQSFVKMFLATFLRARNTIPLFERVFRNFRETSSQVNVREPGENPGRLRHCMEIQTPIAMRSHCGPSHWSKDREGRSEVRLQVRIPVELRSSGEGWLKVEGRV